jgi:hypothetical protein
LGSIEVSRSERCTGAGAVGRDIESVPDTAPIFRNGGRIDIFCSHSVFTFTHRSRVRRSSAGARAWRHSRTHKRHSCTLRPLQRPWQHAQEQKTHRDIVQLCAHACVGPVSSSGTLASPYSALGARHAMAVMQACVPTPLLPSLFSIVRDATAPATARIGQLPEWYQYGKGATAPATARIGQLPEWYQYGKGATAPATARIGQLPEWYQYVVKVRAPRRPLASVSCQNGISMVWSAIGPASTFVSRPAAWCPPSLSALRQWRRPP